MENGHQVSLLVLDKTAASFYPVHPAIQLIQKDLNFGISDNGNTITRKIKFIGDLFRLRRLLQQLKPTRLIATEYPFAAASILTHTQRQTKIFAWEHHHYFELPRSRFWNGLVRRTYSKLDGIVVLNSDEKKLFQPLNPLVSVIPNFIRASGERSNLSQPTLLTIARLEHVKGMDLLTQVAKNIFTKYPGWKWKVIGTGTWENQIKKEIAAEPVLSGITIQAPVSDKIMSEYAAASIYVMLSRHECFPMTLLEAQSAGLPCISFDCETGPRHIITNDRNGVLVAPGDTEKMAESINQLISDEKTRIEMGTRSLEMANRFLPETVYTLWSDLINETND